MEHGEKFNLKKPILDKLKKDFYRGAIVMDFIVQFERMNKRNIRKAKYKIGDMVCYSHDLGQGNGRITGISDTGDGVEYSVDDFFVLLWEDELVKLSTI